MTAALALALLAASAATPEAGAASPARFGDKGQVVPTGSVSAAYAMTAGSYEWALAARPGLLVFVTRGFAVGGGVTLAGSSAATWTAVPGRPAVPGRSYLLEYGLAPAVAANLWLGESVSVLPRASAGISWSRYIGEQGRWRYLWLSLEAPLLFHVTPHLFLGGGPALSRRLWTSWTEGATEGTPGTIGSTAIALQSIIGGWF
jgi:hypothetical protein